MSPTTTGPLFRATRAEKPASPRALRAALHAVSSRWISTAARAVGHLVLAAPQHLLDHRRRVVALEAGAHQTLELRLAGVADALHRHRGVVGEGGQEVEVALAEGADLERRVDLHDADDPLAR